MPEQSIWSEVSQRLKGSLSAKEFDTWFGPLDIKVEDSKVILVVPNHFYTDWIKENYRQTLEQAVASSLGREVELEFELGERTASPAPRAARPAMPRRDTVAGDYVPAPLNDRYTFSTFVVGPCNELAYAASRAVAEQPGRYYNPLFLFGGAGLGKTHLLTAAANHLLDSSPGMNIYFSSAESFTNELIKAVRVDGIHSFQAKFRQMDALLLDDIHFLAGRERTQEEFFHTFNALFDNGKQVVVTSDKMPREIPGLEKRLCTRFEWGLLADMQPPDEETKIAILQHKAEEKGLHLSRKVYFFLAQQPESNVRVLEGYLNRLLAVSRVRGQEVSLDMVRRVLGPVMKRREVGLEDIIKTSATHFGLKVSDIKGSSKTREISQARQVAMYLARRHTRHSFPEIGRAFGGKDHSTVVKGVQKIAKLLLDNSSLVDTVRSLERAIFEDPGVPSGEYGWSGGG